MSSPPILISPDLTRCLLYVNSHNQQPWRVQSGNLSSQKSSVSIVMKTRHCVKSRITWRPCTILTSRKFHSWHRIGSLCIRLTQEIVHRSTKGNSRNGVSAKTKHERPIGSSSGDEQRKENETMKKKARFTSVESSFGLKRSGKQSTGRPLYRRWTWSLVVRWRLRQTCPVRR